MDTVKLNGRKMTTREETHDYIKEAFDFPEYYGNNLDALWDMLTTICEPTEVLLKNGKAICENLGEYGVSLINTLVEAAEKNGDLTLIITK